MKVKYFVMVLKNLNSFELFSQLLLKSSNENFTNFSEELRKKLIYFVAGERNSLEYDEVESYIQNFPILNRYVFDSEDARSYFIDDVFNLNMGDNYDFSGYSFTDKEYSQNDINKLGSVVSDDISTSDSCMKIILKNAKGLKIPNFIYEEVKSLTGLSFNWQQEVIAFGTYTLKEIKDVNDGRINKIMIFE